MNEILKYTQDRSEFIKSYLRDSPYVSQGNGDRLQGKLDAFAEIQEIIEILSGN